MTESDNQGAGSTDSMGVKRQPSGGDQRDLFDEALKASLRHGVPGESGTGTGSSEEQQAHTAWAEDRALTQHLMEEVASSANLNQAYKRVKANGGAAGIDGMTVVQLRPWIGSNRERLIASLLDGSYRSMAVRGVEIPKADGGMRQLGIALSGKGWWRMAGSPSIRSHARRMVRQSRAGAPHQPSCRVECCWKPPDTMSTSGGVRGGDREESPYSIVGAARIKRLTGSK
jgi:hypothetical protein